MNIEAIKSMKPVVKFTLALIVVMLFAGCGDRGEPSEHDEAAEKTQSSTATEEKRVPDFNYDRAYNVAGQFVPPDKDSFYLFDVEDAENENDAVTDLKGMLQKAHNDKDYIAIVGPQSSKNKRVLTQALDNYDKDSLAEMLLIYLGPKDHREEVAAMVHDKGATFYFAIFP